jgi:hypothetical protein
VTQKNLLYFVNRFNLLLHHAEMNHALSQQTLMQLVHELQGSVDDLELKEMHPADAFSHSLLTLEAVDLGRSVAKEAAAWIADHHDRMLDVRDFEAHWRSTDPELTHLPVHHLVLYRSKGVVGYFLRLEQEMKNLHAALRTELVDPKFHDELVAAYKQKDMAAILAHYEKATWVKPYWHAVHQLHDQFSFRVVRMNIK